MIIYDDIDSVTGISRVSMCHEFTKSTQDFLNTTTNDFKVPVRVITAIQIGVGESIITCTSAQSAALAYAMQSTEIWELTRDYTSLTDRIQRTNKMYNKVLPLFNKYFVEVKDESKI